MEKKDEKKKTAFQEFLEETQRFPGETKRSVLSAGAVEYIHLNKRVEDLIKPFWPNIQSKPTTFPPDSHDHVHELLGSDHTVSGLIPGSVLAAITENMIGFKKLSELAEVDPIYMASAAHGIAAGDITNWNTAYGWGNHAGLYTPLAHKTTEDAINGLVFVNGAGTYSAKAIGTDVQAYNASLAAIAAGTWTGANSITTLGSITTGGWHGTTVAIDHGGTGATTAALAATALGVGTGDSPVFVTAKLSALTPGYFPYHVTDATGFANSPLYEASATQLVLGNTTAMSDPASPGFTIASTTDASLGLVATALAGFGSFYLRNSLADVTWCLSIRNQAGAHAFQIGYHNGTAWQPAYVVISTAGVVTLGSLAGILKGTAGAVSAITNTTSADYMGGDAAYHTLNQAAVAGLTTADSPTWVTGKFTALTDGYIPYHVSDAAGLANSGIQADSSGRIGIGGIPSAQVIMRMVGDLTTGTVQYGNFTDCTLSGTLQNNMFYVGGTIKAATAITHWRQFYIGNPDLGAGASVVNQYGLYIAAQTRGGTINYAIYAGGNSYFVGDVNCGSLTDHTVYPKSKAEAYAAVMSMIGDDKGQLIHDSLHSSIRRIFRARVSEDPTDNRTIERQGRNLSASVSAINEVTKDLISRVTKLETN